MSENPNDETQPVRPAGTPPTPPQPGSPADPVAQEAAPRRGFRDRFRRLGRTRGTGERAFGLGALIASTLAGVIVGGLGGVLLHAAVDDDRGDHGRGERHELGQGRFGDGDGYGGGERGLPGGPGAGFPGAPPGGLPPSTPPDDDGDADGESRS